MPLFICVTVLTTAASSILFYYAAKRLGINNKRLIAAVSALNALFCAAFPLLFAFVSGWADGRAPMRRPAAVFAALILWTAAYVAIILWRVVLRSPSFRFKAQIPVPDPDGPVLEPVNIKNNIDSAINIGKMGMNAELRRDNGENDVFIHEIHENSVDSLINRAFDCLNGGKKEEAAEYFYSAIEMRPPLSLELQIAIQLSMIYMELGRADLSFDIMTGYDEKYRDRLSGEDKGSLDAGLSIIKSAVAGVGGNGYEKD